MKSKDGLFINRIGLEENQLERYLEKLAIEQDVSRKSDLKTYPINQIELDYKEIVETYNLLNEHIKLGISIHPAGEWLLDNLYVIEETYKMIKNDLNSEVYIKLPGLISGQFKGYARIYIIASEIVAYTDGILNKENIEKYINAYQRNRNLEMDEIYILSLFLQIVLLQRIKEVAKRVYIAQEQKYRVENIIERLVEYNYENTDKLKFKEKENWYKYSNDKLTEFKNLKYSFIEYMSFRLKQYGKNGNAYLEVLEEQVNKLGLSVSEVIRKEHFEIALNKVIIGNCIKSIHKIRRINFEEIFENSNGVEKILNQDPCNIYKNMDYMSKERYRKVIKQIANNKKMSEIYIAKKVIEVAENVPLSDDLLEQKKRHVGYYLIGNGRDKFLKYVGINKKYYMYISIIVAIESLVLLTLIYQNILNFNVYLIVLISIFITIPVYQIIKRFIQNVYVKRNTPCILPKINLFNGIPKELSTIVVIPTIVDNVEKVKNIYEKLEVYYLANKSKNLYFCLLGDCTSQTVENNADDDKIVQEIKNQIDRLNKKYSEDINIFYGIYRKRVWNDKEKIYLGWERKRGLLEQFNKFILGKSKNEFKYNSFLEQSTYCELYGDNHILKYVITLDSDTNLIINSASKLIGAASHILNKPIINQYNIVDDGYGIIAPRVCIDIKESNINEFTKLFSQDNGIDLYSNSVSDWYQDYIEEGIYTGKGIYNIEVFDKVLENRISENKVLSHDLIEGIYARCAYSTDIVLLDGMPSNYISFRKRNHRWVRGDFQISEWLEKNIRNRSGELEENYISKFSKYKILDNLLRELSPICMLLLIISFFSIISLNIKFDKLQSFNLGYIFIFVIIIMNIFYSSLQYLFNRIVYKKKNEIILKTFNCEYTKGTKVLFRDIIDFMILPDTAIQNLNAIIKVFYRKNISKCKLLEWETSEQVENNSKNITQIDYYKLMKSNIVFAIILFVIALYSKNSLLNLIAVLISVTWLCAPLIMFKLGEKKKDYSVIDKESIRISEFKNLFEIAKRTWSFFELIMNSKNNYLPIDNYQEDRKEKMVDRTSSTNIGLGLISIISAYNLKFINTEKAITMINNVIDTIEALPKYNGHLYNWYNVKKLEPLYPRYISTVDSGNLIGYLFVLKGFLLDICKDKKNIENNNESDIENKNILSLLNKIDELINNMDFEFLFDKEKNVFSIGYNIEENKLTPSYYDLLASEARQTSIIAIAKGDIPLKHWSSLSRTLTVYDGYKGLVSWSGTSFEYLMPNINIPQYQGSLLKESSEFSVRTQMKYCEKILDVWGISESAFYLKDLNENYQYKAFGIPWLGLKRGLANEVVISPYASILALNINGKAVIKNIEKLKEYKAFGKYGFYEAIDFTQSRLNKNQRYVVVPTYMAHHQGLILASINNYINGNILIKYFLTNPEIKKIDSLLQETMPSNVVIAKEKKEKIEKIKYKDYEDYLIKEIQVNKKNLREINLISNGEYSSFISENGEGFSKYKDILVNRYKLTDEEKQGIKLYFKNTKNNKIWSSIYDKEIYNVKFMPDKVEFNNKFDNIKIDIINSIVSDKNVEIRKIEIKNIGQENENIEVYAYIEPILTSLRDYAAHRAFSNLFLSYEKVDDIIIVKRNNKVIDNKINDIYLAVKIFEENNKVLVSDFNFEIDKEKFVGRNNIGIPATIINSDEMENKIKLVTEGCIALKKTLYIKSDEVKSLSLIMAVGENKDELIKQINELNSNQKIEKELNVSKSKTEAENRYLNISSNNIEINQKLLKFILNKKLKNIYNLANKDYLKCEEYSKTYSINNLWSCGISGDYPIVVIQIKDIHDTDNLRQILNVYEYYKNKNLKIDIVILDYEIRSYENIIERKIRDIIIEKNLEYAICRGIFIITDVNKFKEIEYRANIIFESGKGNILVQLIEKENELEKIIKDRNKNKFINDNENFKNNYLEYNKNYIDINNLKFFNGYGGFKNDNKYVIRINSENRLPTTWSYIMANKKFGTIITDNLGGNTWYKNSRLNRISWWSNDVILDQKSEKISIKDNDNIWTIGEIDKNDKNDRYLEFGNGIIKYYERKNNLNEELEIFVPLEDSIKIINLNMKSIINKNKKEDKKENKKYIIYTINLVLGEDELYTYSHLRSKFIKEENIIYIRNIVENEINNIIGISSNLNIAQSSIDENGILEVVFEINENQENIIILLATEDDEKSCLDLLFKYNDIKNINEEKKKLEDYWIRTNEKIQVKTPSESLNILMNTWLLYQTKVCRINAKSAVYQSGGAIGFRDQLQDTISLKYTDVDLMKEQILKSCSHQFEEGDVEHWWHEISGKGVRTRISDDLLWLPYMICEYIEYSEDYSILDEKIKYLSAPELREDEKDRYEKYYESKVEENVYEHCKRAIKKASKFGNNGLPLIGSGDWNDGFSNIGIKGKGESVWLGFFLGYVLEKFNEISQYKNDIEFIEENKKIICKLKESLNVSGWDENWFKRAFDDEGEILGGEQSKECKIDSISQSWSVISNVGDEEKKKLALKSIDEKLVDKQNKLIKLFWPPFERNDINVGYVQGYIPGTRENGGQYTHAAIWVIMANCIMKNGNKAVELFNLINPIEHSKNKVEADKYKVEPYVVSADVYSKDNLAGQGGWTWYTGSASWMYEVCLKYILGLRITGTELDIRPCISEKWEDYSIKYEYHNSIYDIHVINKNHKQYGVEKVIFDGRIMSNNKIKLQDDGRIHTIEILM